MPHLIQMLAADTTAVPDVSQLFNYGAVGVLAALGAWFARVAYKREAERADRLDAEVIRLNGVIQEKCIPALLAAGAALERSAKVLAERSRDDL